MLRFRFIQDQLYWYDEAYCKSQTVRFEAGALIVAIQLAQSAIYQVSVWKLFLVMFRILRITEANFQKSSMTTVF